VPSFLASGPAPPKEKSMITISRLLAARGWLSIMTLAGALVLGLLFAPAVRAGMIEVAPGATRQIDVGDRYNYTTITITNAGAAAGRLEFGTPVDQAVDVPDSGSIELYGRYGRSPTGGNYVTVKNSGSVPLRILSRYQETVRSP
jgi:hypothetical protein